MGWNKLLKVVTKNERTISYNKISLAAEMITACSVKLKTKKLCVSKPADDLVIAGSNNESIEHFKKLLKENLNRTMEVNSNGS